jgi:hypothetical protein
MERFEYLWAAWPPGGLEHQSEVLGWAASADNAEFSQLPGPSLIAPGDEITAQGGSPSLR